MAKVKVVIESDEAINVKVTKQPEQDKNNGLDKLKADLEQADDDAAEKQGGNDATENT